MASTSSGGYTAPVGLDGDTNSSALVRGVRAAVELLDRDLNPASQLVWTSTGTPPARRITSG